MTYTYLSTRGSPPRMRGIRVLVGLLRPGKGITPAHAGNTLQNRKTRMKPEDHPRACGEYLCCFFFKPLFLGSPPRMRGIPISPCLGSLAGRITPAHAGNTLIAEYIIILRRDHPRACGEYTPAPARSGPLAGITPAHAGNTDGITLYLWCVWDHPRACGEYLL